MPETITRRQTEHPHDTDTSTTAAPNSRQPATFRRGLSASWLFACIRPDDAAGITIGRETLALTTSAGQREIRMRDMGAISTIDQWFWRGVRIRTRRGEANISGLNRQDATTAKTAIEEAQTSWWREHLSEHARTVTALDAQLAGLDTPQGRLGPKAFRSRIEKLKRQAASLPKRWPKKINAVPLAVAIARIRTMLARADTALRRGRVDDWRGGGRRTGVAVSGGFRQVPVPHSPPWLRFQSPLIEPDVRISRIRLSDEIMPSHTESSPFAGQGA